MQFEQIVPATGWVIIVEEKYSSIGQHEGPKYGFRDLIAFALTSTGEILPIILDRDTNKAAPAPAYALIFSPSETKQANSALSKLNFGF